MRQRRRGDGIYRFTAHPQALLSCGLKVGPAKVRPA